VIKFVSDLREVNGFLLVMCVFSTNKTDRQDIAEILLKVTLKTIKPNYIYILLLNCICFHFSR